MFKNLKIVTKLVISFGIILVFFSWSHSPDTTEWIKSLTGRTM